MKKPREQFNSCYPDVITCLPEAEVPVEGGRAWILQSQEKQLVFFEFLAEIKLPEHSHIYPQWGMVVEGKMELTVNGKARVFQTGDEYLVPAGAMHSVRFLEKSRVMDFFSEKSRYKQKLQK